MWGEVAHLGNCGEGMRCINLRVGQSASPMLERIRAF